MAQYTSILNRLSDTVFVVMSGISGGKDEPLVRFLCDALHDHGSVIAIQFANDPLLQNQELPEMNELAIEDYFTAIDTAISTARGATTRIVLVAHSFSAIIATLYVQQQAHDGFVLITIDSDDSSAVLAYADSLNELDRDNKYRNPFSMRSMAFLRTHDSANVWDKLTLPKLRIDARDCDSDHDFSDVSSKQQLVSMILTFLHTI